MTIRVCVPLVHEPASEPEHMCEAILDRHTAGSGATAQPHKHYDLRARNEELFRLSTDVVKDPREVAGQEAPLALSGRLVRPVRSPCITSAPSS